MQGEVINKFGSNKVKLEHLQLIVITLQCYFSYITNM